MPLMLLLLLGTGAVPAHCMPSKITSSHKRALASKAVTCALGLQKASTYSRCCAAGSPAGPWGQGRQLAFSMVSSAVQLHSRMHAPTISLLMPWQLIIPCPYP